ncbi:hypothetical protein L6164_008095 [Bauhinia variegata]|uniref:Uncharacterized protein n=1 Tax=Bauhinia variegata TaxID=167791 RepID=A0ACB9PFR8_BAUVA|nr:hypothetical protein L6164_008095 [Bauhinia variegata]
MQGMYVFCNIASGNEFHKEAVMQLLFLQCENETHSVIMKLLQSNDRHLRTAAAWVIVLCSVVDALTHDNAKVRSAACICIRSVCHSIKNVSAGCFMNEKSVVPLVQLLSDLSTSVQVCTYCSHDLRFRASGVINIIIYPTSQRFLDGRKASCKACTMQYHDQLPQLESLGQLAKSKNNVRAVSELFNFVALLTRGGAGEDVPFLDGDGKLAELLKHVFI